MHGEKQTSSNTMLVITNESNLPQGKIVSAPGDELEVKESLRKELLAYDVSIEPNKRTLWILSIKSSYNSLDFLQLVKKAESVGYKIAKRGLIEPNVLSLLYDRRNTADSQKASSDDSAVVGMFELMLSDALTEKGISDIHIEVRPSGTVIRMRKNGDLMEYNLAGKTLTYDEGNNLCSVMYNVLASTKATSFDPKDCQQAEVNYSIKEQDLKLRYQSVPAYIDGYDVVLRILPIGRSEDFVPLQKLGYTDQQVEDLLNISSRPVGALIIAGVTGSGKSTTLKNLLMYINANAGYRIKIYSIEDPPEYNIAKITQIPVVIGKHFDPTKYSPFEKPIKACMRGDPDIIMIGEVRDKITGDLTKKAVQSGHQVLTTVHSTSGLGIIDRFQDFGLSKSVLGSPDFLTGLLYQKLLPIVCKHCGTKLSDFMQSDQVTTKDLGLFSRLSSVVDPNDFNIMVRNKNGCSHCKFTGVAGRSVAAEVIMIDLEMMQLISEGKVIELMRYWRSLSDKDPVSENMRGKTCMEHGFQKVLSGQVCPFDLEQEFKPIDEMLMKSAPTLKTGKSTISEDDFILETEDMTEWIETTVADKVAKDSAEQDVSEFKEKLEKENWASL